ncbi:C-type lectin domain family 2 member B-like isoform X2 [Eleutherodactylus coqui]|uniref:C-type lectin domain family 2 member B-like isoform X2 n=1 Tax=Eleutherodactylus coqui TaxID=57060 RepID=UPI003463595C
MRRLKKPKVQKYPCNITTEDSGQNFQNDSREFDLAISRKYIYAITDLCAATGDICELCPLNWDAFNGKCYFFSEDRNNLSFGENNCELRKAELISIEDLEEQIGYIRRASVCHLRKGVISRKLF